MPIHHTEIAARDLASAVVGTNYEMHSKNLQNFMINYMEIHRVCLNFLRFPLRQRFRISDPDSIGDSK